MKGDGSHKNSAATSTSLTVSYKHGCTGSKRVAIDQSGRVNNLIGVEAGAVSTIIRRAFELRHSLCLGVEAAILIFFLKYGSLALL